MKKYIVFGLLMFVSTTGYSQTDSLLLKINKDFNGWCYIIGSEKRKSSRNLDTIIPNKNKVYYVKKDILYKNLKVRFFRNNRDITDSIKFIFSENGTISNQTKQPQQYKIIKFYIPSLHEKDEGEVFWNNAEIQKKYLRNEKQNRNKLIENGKIKF